MSRGRIRWLPPPDTAKRAECVCTRSGSVIVMTRRIITLAIATTALGGGGLAASSALGSQNYCDPLSGCNTLSASPSSVAPGHVTKIHGTVSGGCKLPGSVTLYSRAFKGATRKSFAGVPAFFVRASRSGAFSLRVKIDRRVKPAKYHVGGRCGGGNFGSATLKVT